MIKHLDTSETSFWQQFEDRFFQTTTIDKTIGHTVSEIIQRVISEGDKALIELTQRFDHNPIKQACQLRIDPISFSKKINSLSSQIIADLELAIERIRAFHEKQLTSDWHFRDDHGVLLGQRVQAIERAGVYVPGGKASYPSSILMNVIPAQVAGVGEIHLVTPAMHGELNPIILKTAMMLGIDHIYQIGGAQAVAALAYGTETIPPVDKITGPGNAYVAEAKRQVFGQCGIDMIAGPSEVVIIADEGANPTHIALDLFAQAEHDELARAVLLCHDMSIIQKTEQAIAETLDQMPREAIIRQSLQNFGALIKTKNLQESIDISNKMAPEHLQLCTQQPKEVMTQVQSAGAIFLGYDTPEAFGDYLAGSNHVLPTSGSARFSSPLGVYDFQKRSSYLSASKQAITKLYPVVSRLAEEEKLSAHAASCHVRIE